MDALIIGPSRGLADAIARSLRRRGRSALRAIASDVSDPERAMWLLDEAGRPALVIVVDSAPYATAHGLLALTSAQVVLVAEQRVAIAGPGARPARALIPRDQPWLTVLPLGRAGGRWLELGSRRHGPIGAERAAAVVLRACGAAAASCR